MNSAGPLPVMARNGRIGPIWRCPLTGVRRKWLADRQTDPNRTFKVVSAPADPLSQSRFEAWCHPVKKSTEIGRRGLSLRMQPHKPRRRVSVVRTFNPRLRLSGDLRASVPRRRQPAAQLKPLRRRKCLCDCAAIITTRNRRIDARSSIQLGT